MDPASRTHSRGIAACCGLRGGTLADQLKKKPPTPREAAKLIESSLEIADKAGISRDNLVLDPGIGFGKTSGQSMTALARIGGVAAALPVASCVG